MIKKKEYEKALLIVNQYESERKDNVLLIDMARIEYPIGTFVVSKLNTAIRGVVVDYQMWSGIVQLVCMRNENKTTMLIHNAKAMPDRMKKRISKIGNI